MEQSNQDTFLCKDDEGDTLLHIAVAKNSDKVTSILQDERCKEILNAQNREGQTPLHLAVIMGQEEVVKSLLNAGALQSLRMTKDGDTAQHLAARLGKNKCLQILCLSADEETLQIQNEAGDSALHTTIAVNNYKGFEILLQKYQDVNCKNHKRKETPLHYAVRENKLEMVKLLLDCGADVNAVTVDGNTPLHGVANKEQRDMAKALLEKGADIYVQNEAGKSPHDQADKTLARFLTRNRQDRKTRSTKRKKEGKMDVDMKEEVGGSARSSGASKAEGLRSKGAVLDPLRYPGKKPKQNDDDNDEESDNSMDISDKYLTNPNVFAPLPNLFFGMLDEQGGAAESDAFQFPNTVITTEATTDNLTGNYSPAVPAFHNQDNMQPYRYQQQDSATSIPEQAADISMLGRATSFDRTEPLQQDNQAAMQTGMPVTSVNTMTSHMNQNPQIMVDANTLSGLIQVGLTQLFNQQQQQQ